jgi:hypothetical protein
MGFGAFLRGPLPLMLAGGERINEAAHNNQCRGGQSESGTAYNNQCRGGKG